jgi:hypothetical protein
MGVHMTLPSCPVAMLARAYSLLLAQWEAGDDSPALDQTMRGVIRRASHEAPGCPEGVAFLIYCLEAESTFLHDIEDIDERSASHGAIHRMLKTLKTAYRCEGRAEAAIAEAA